MNISYEKGLKYVDNEIKNFQFNIDFFCEYSYANS